MKSIEHLKESMVIRFFGPDDHLYWFIRDFEKSSVDRYELNCTIIGTQHRQISNNCIWDRTTCQEVVDCEHESIMLKDMGV